MGTDAKEILAMISEITKEKSRGRNENSENCMF